MRAGDVCTPVKTIAGRRELSPALRRSKVCKSISSVSFNELVNDELIIE